MQLCNPQVVRGLLEKYSLAPKKAFGQNFLINHTGFHDPCAQLQPFPEVTLVQLKKCLKGHVEVAFALVQKLPFPFQSFPLG